MWIRASLAQLVEHALRKHMAMGLIPIGGSVVKRMQRLRNGRLCCETHAKATKWEGRKVDAFGAGTSKENENAWEVWFAGWSRRLGGPVAQWTRRGHLSNVMILMGGAGKHAWIYTMSPPGVE